MNVYGFFGDELDAEGNFVDYYASKHPLKWTTEQANSRRCGACELEFRLLGHLMCKMPGEVSVRV